MNNKGFTLVELLVSFTLSMIIVIILFQLIINLKEVYVQTGLKTELLNKQNLMENKIYNDLLNRQVTSIDNCNTGLLCINFTYENGDTKKLELNNIEQTLSYDGFIIKLNNNSYFQTINVITKESQTNSKYNRIFDIKIPIYNDTYENTDFGINIVYIYDSTVVTNNYTNYTYTIE